LRGEHVTGRWLNTSLNWCTRPAGVLNVAVRYTVAEIEGFDIGAGALARFTGRRLILCGVLRMIQ